MLTVTVKGVADIGKLMGKGEQKIALSRGSTLRNLLSVLKEKHGKPFQERVFQEGSEVIRMDLRLLLNGRDIAFLKGLDTELNDNDRFSIIPPLAGG